MNPIRIALADDQRVFRKGLISLLNNMEGMEVIIEAGNGKELLEQMSLQKIAPDVVILDLNMPGLSGVETMPMLKAQYPQIKVMVLSLYNDENFVAYLTEKGADSYLFKDSDPQTIQQAIYNMAGV